MNYNLQTLPSGLRILSVPMVSSESATVTIWVKTGSRNESPEKLGISHYLEHMVFKGSKKFPTMRELFEVFDSMGAEHNAGTSKEWTNFWVKLPAFDLERGFEILSDVVLNPLLDKAEAIKEREVIFQEMKMYEDTPTRHIADIFEELIYAGSPLGLDTIGTVESMNNIQRSDFEDYRKKYYFAENMLISVAGGVKPEKVMDLAKKYFSSVKSANHEALPLFESGQSSPKVKIKNKKTDQAHFILGFLTTGRNYKFRFAQAVMSAILGGGASSRLWTEVREKRGLAYGVHGSIDRYADVGYFGVYTGTGIEKSYDAVKVILDQCYGLSTKKYKISDKEIEKVKGFLKGHLALQLEDSDYVNDFFSEQVLFDKQVLKPEDIFKEVDKVTVDEVYAEAGKVFRPEGLNLAVIGPYKNDSEFVKLLK
jgi:predicted Zn-dependent peptidase